MEPTQVFIKIVLDAWHTAISRTDDIFNKLSDEEMAQEVSAGRNTGTYLLGHLAAVHDRMLPLLGLGERSYPELDEPFLTSPDKSGKAIPAVAELRACWKKSNDAVAAGFAKLTPAEWMGKHTTVSEEDFAKEPHRNKLNVVVNRTNHLSSHYGQLLFLLKK